MKGKIIKGIAGFYYVHVADDGHTMGTVYELSLIHISEPTRPY